LIGHTLSGLLVIVFHHIFETQVKVAKNISAYFSKEGEKESNRCIGEKSSLHIASFAGEQGKIPRF
jgi:hypothetical protein